MKNEKYKIGLNRSMYIECLTCEKKSYNMYDIKYRYCPVCGFLNPEKRKEELLKINQDFKKTKRRYNAKK